MSSAQWANWLAGDFQNICNCVVSSVTTFLCHWTHDYLFTSCVWLCLRVCRLTEIKCYKRIHQIRTLIDVCHQIIKIDEKYGPCSISTAEKFMSVQGCTVGLKDDQAFLLSALNPLFKNTVTTHTPQVKMSWCRLNTQLLNMKIVGIKYLFEYIVILSHLFS